VLGPQRHTCTYTHTHPHTHAHTQYQSLTSALVVLGVAKAMSWFNSILWCGVPTRSVLSRTCDLCAIWHIHNCDMTHSIIILGWGASRNAVCTREIQRSIRSVLSRMSVDEWVTSRKTDLTNESRHTRQIYEWITSHRTDVWMSPTGRMCHVEKVRPAWDMTYSSHESCHVQTSCHVRHDWFIWVWHIHPYTSFPKTSDCKELSESKSHSKTQKHKVSVQIIRFKEDNWTTLKKDPYLGPKHCGIRNYLIHDLLRLWHDKRYSMSNSMSRMRDLHTHTRTPHTAPR